MRKLFALFFLLIPISYADTCPPAADVQHNQIKGWRIYDSDTNALVPSDRASSFRAAAKKFALAESVTGGKKRGAIHCYYSDQEGSNLEAYIAKDNFMMSNTNKAWYQVTGSMQCAVNSNNCHFEPIPLTGHLASKN